MKNTVILILAILVFPISGISQNIKNLDFISPIHEELVAIKKEGQWAFINTNGDIVINFRDDLVPTSMGSASYPIFRNQRCIIKKEKDGISYFGYIDTSGKIVVEPLFLNAGNFNNGQALALKLIKDKVSKNKALDKDIVYYKYCEVIIDKNGDPKIYLNPEGINIVLDKDYIRKPPSITAERVSDNLFAFKGNNTKWTLIKVDD